MDYLQRAVIRDAASMERFASGDKTFVLGEWKEWRDASREAGKWLDPEAFKKRKTDSA